MKNALAYCAELKMLMGKKFNNIGPPLMLLDTLSFLPFQEGANVKKLFFHHHRQSGRIS
jgi:hypothetical protein